jgi:hypothetical protein
MKVYIDRQKLNARAQAAHFASIGGLALLLLSVAVPLFLPNLAGITSVVMVIGAMGAMVGIYLANRWVRRPRPEESLDKALRAFDDNYRIFHYPSSLPCEHVLLTPQGVIALEVVNLNGYFSYRNGRWKEAMTMGRALRYLVEERVSDPVLLAQAMIKELGDRFEKELGEPTAISIKALTVFTHPAVELEVEGGPIPAVKAEKLRKQVSMPGSRLESETYEKICAYLERLTVP